MADSDSGISALVRIYHTGLVWHCICAIARLEVADRLASGPLPPEILADSVGVEKDALLRVLKLLGDYGLFEFSNDKVALTNFGRLLCKEHPSSAWSMFATVGLPDVAHALEESLRTGEVAAERVLGSPYWQYLAAHPDKQAIFDDYMRMQTNWLVENCITMLQWPPSGTIVDIGGGIGTLLSAVLRTAPGLNGILVDQKQVVARAQLVLGDEMASGRCEVRAADLFSPAPRGDIYLLSYVLHDWPDPDAVRILDAIGKQAPESSRLRIFECVIPENGLTHVSRLSDVGMLLLLGGGRERTEAGFRHLLRLAGWRVETITAWGSTSLIEACRLSSGPN